LRFDRWSALREATTSIGRETEAGKIVALKSRVSELFEALKVIEPYWAFPGMSAFDHLRRHFDHGNFEDLAFGVQRVTRALTRRCCRPRRAPWRAPISRC
jgi:arginine decarboxylase